MKLCDCKTTHIAYDSWKTGQWYPEDITNFFKRSIQPGTDCPITFWCFTRPKIVTHYKAYWMCHFDRNLEILTYRTNYFLKLAYMYDNLLLLETNFNQRATNLDVCNLGFAPHCYKQPKNVKEHATLDKYSQPTGWLGTLPPIPPF